jgi:hypothetical protein
MFYLFHWRHLTERRIIFNFEVLVIKQTEKRIVSSVRMMLHSRGLSGKLKNHFRTHGKFLSSEMTQQLQLHYY